LAEIADMNYTLWASMDSRLDEYTVPCVQIWKIKPTLSGGDWDVDDPDYEYDNMYPRLFEIFSGGVTLEPGELWKCTPETGWRKDTA